MQVATLVLLFICYSVANPLEGPKSIYDQNFRAERVFNTNFESKGMLDMFVTNCQFIFQ